MILPFREQGKRWRRSTSGTDRWAPGGGCCYAAGAPGVGVGVIGALVVVVLVVVVVVVVVKSPIRTVHSVNIRHAR